MERQEYDAVEGQRKLPKKLKHFENGAISVPGD